MEVAVRTLAALALLLAATGCGAPGTYGGPSFTGTWAAEDDELGRLEVSARDGPAGEVQCDLVDVDGKRREVDGFPRDQEGTGVLEETLDVEEHGLKVLFDDPPEALHPKGTIAFTGGEVRLRLTRRQREGKEVLWLECWRAKRPADTRRTLHLLLVSPIPKARD